MAEKRKAVNEQPEPDQTMSVDDYYMSLAYITSLRSEDPVTKVGACIVDQDNRVVGLAYNRMPDRCKDLPWTKKTTRPMEEKKLYVCHAEMNAIVNSTSAGCKNFTIYTTLFPCNECAKIILQAGINRVVFLEQEEDDKPKYKASWRMFKNAGIVCEKLQSSIEPILINLNNEN